MIRRTMLRQAWELSLSMLGVMFPVMMGWPLMIIPRRAVAVAVSLDRRVRGPIAVDILQPVRNVVLLRAFRVEKNLGTGPIFALFMSISLFWRKLMKRKN